MVRTINLRFFIVLLSHFEYAFELTDIFVCKCHSELWPAPQPGTPTFLYLRKDSLCIAFCNFTVPLKGHIKLVNELHVILC